MSHPVSKSSGLSEVVDKNLVHIGNLNPGQALPLLISPAGTNEVDLISWARNNKPYLEERLLDNGGILFRGFGNFEADYLEDFIRAVAGEPLQYQERSSPRTQVEGKIYTSTEHPPNQWIFLHNENSYQHTWPMKIFFLCETAAEEEGETPIADCRKVFERINPDLRARFEEKGFQIVRNYNNGMGLDWETVFQTEDKAKVDAYCSEKGIETQWKSDGGLRTITRRPKAGLHHPKSGAMTWFNHGTFFHVSTLEPMIRDVLLACMAEEDLPTNTYYGDGSPIAPEDLDHLRDCYRQEMIRFPWQRGDILMLDNMLTAHGRAPFKGKRKILVGMAEPMDREQALAATEKGA